MKDKAKMSIVERMEFAAELERNFAVHALNLYTREKGDKTQFCSLVFMEDKGQLRKMNRIINSSKDQKRQALSFGEAWLMSQACGREFSHIFLETELRTLNGEVMEEDKSSRSRSLRSFRRSHTSDTNP